MKAERLAKRGTASAARKEPGQVEDLDAATFLIGSLDVQDVKSFVETG
jgi:hypothetical protein